MSDFEKKKLALRKHLCELPSQTRTSNILELLQAGVKPDWYDMRLLCDEDDPELLQLFLNFPHICELISEDMCAYVFENENLANHHVLYELLENVLYKNTH